MLYILSTVRQRNGAPPSQNGKKGERKRRKKNQTHENAWVHAWCRPVRYRFSFLISAWSRGKKDRRTLFACVCPVHSFGNPKKRTHGQMGVQQWTLHNTDAESEIPRTANIRIYLDCWWWWRYARILALDIRQRLIVKTSALAYTRTRIHTAAAHRYGTGWRERERDKHQPSKKIHYIKNH